MLFHAHTLITLHSVLWLCGPEEKGTQIPLAYTLKTLLCAISECVRERQALCCKNVKCEVRPYSTSLVDSV